MPKPSANADLNLNLSPKNDCSFIKTSYLPFQIQGIQFLISRYHALLADEMGLGKTVQAIGGINRLRAKSVLIICPSSVKLNWEKELNDWLENKMLKIYVVNGTATSIPNANIIVVNYDIIHHSNIFNQLHARKYDILVCDEAHYLKNLKSKRTKAVLSAKGLARKSLFKWMLTGTPILNRPIELFPMLRTLSPETIAPYGRYDSYAKKFCNGYRKGFTMIARGASNSEELNKRLKQKFMLRRLETEVANELPELRYQAIFLRPDQVKQKLEVVEEVTHKIFKHQKHQMDVTQLAQWRLDLANKKVELALDYIKNLVDEVGKLVIFTYHRSVLQFLNHHLAEYNPKIIQGGLTAYQKQKNLASFMHLDECKVFLGQIQAAGQGIDGLQKVCNHVLFLEWTWVPGEIAQAVKRVHRYGQEKPVLVQFMTWKDSIEEHMMRVALDKIKTIKRTLN
jgi:SWI/SNF-related matrix-associated actin-dependent regulator of chromatin subfamily A-like protein 1